MIAHIDKDERDDAELGCQNLIHDIARHMDIISEQEAEIDRLRAALDRIIIEASCFAVFYDDGPDRSKQWLEALEQGRAALGQSDE